MSESWKPTEEQKALGLVHEDPNAAPETYSRPHGTSAEEQQRLRGEAAGPRFDPLHGELDIFGQPKKGGKP